VLTGHHSRFNANSTEICLNHKIMIYQCLESLKEKKYKEKIYIRLIMLFMLMIMGLIALGAAETVQVGPYLATFDLAGETHSYELPSNYMATKDGAGYTVYTTKIGDDNVLTIELVRYNKLMDTSLEKEIDLLSTGLMEAHQAQGTPNYLSIDGHYGLKIDAVDGSGLTFYSAAYWLDPNTWVIITSYYPLNVTNKILKSFHVTLPNNEQGTSQCQAGCDFAPGKCRYIGNNYVCDGGSCSCGNWGYGLPGGISV